jgi:predicted nucleic acid-binding protein
LVLVYENLPLGTTDATVIAVCERLRLTEVASFDRHHFSVIRPRHVERLRLLPD